tara:strand:+ start:412 stop:648 length:237 start_codon:yes stop_codon:yes gene_type:complete
MADMFEGEPITLAEQIKCAEREVEMRRQVYARRVGKGTMTEDEKDLGIRQMQAVLVTLKKVADAPKPVPYDILHNDAH